MLFGDQYGVGHRRTSMLILGSRSHFNVLYLSVLCIVDHTCRCSRSYARMKECRSTKPTHKEWRRIAKKERRRRIRRLTAQERDANEERLVAALESNMEYLKFCAEKENHEKEKEEQEQKEHAEREKLWLEEEVNIYI